MSVYNYKQRIEYWLRRIDDEYSKSADLIHRFADALRLAGVGDAKIVNYVQFAYEILKVNDNDNDNNSSNSSNNSSKPIKDWSREDVDRVASKILREGMELLNYSNSIKSIEAFGALCKA
jgi:hypothetical protein